MKKIIFSILFLFFFCITVFAQDAPSTGLAPFVYSTEKPSVVFNDLAATSRGFSYNSTSLTASTLIKYFLSTPGSAANIGSAQPYFLGSGDQCGPAGSQVIYVIQQLSPYSLYSVDTTTGALTNLGTITGINPAHSSGGITGLCWDATSNTAYVSSTSITESELYTFNLSTRVATPVGSAITNAPGIIALACNPGGTIFGIDLVNDNLWKFNKSNGTATLVGPLGMDANYGQDADFDPRDGILYWAAIGTSNPANLRTVDTTTGASTMIGAFTGQNQVLATIVPGAPAGPPATPPYYNYMVTGTNNSFPLGIGAGKMVQWLIPPAAQTGGWNTPTVPLSGGMINAVYIWIGSTYPLGPTTYNNFEILMGQTNLTTLTTGQFYSGTMDTVYARTSITLQGALNSWVPIALDNPIPYDPNLGLVLQIGQCSATGLLNFPICHTSISDIHRVWSVGGCPFVPYATGGDGNVIHTGINIVYPTGTSHNGNTIPGDYKLEQNYPNPFNPITKISYSLPKSELVRIVVYDYLGREVAVLVNESKTPGTYNVDFDGTNLASGLYLYRIVAGDYTATKKMMLVK